MHHDGKPFPECIDYRKLIYDRHPVKIPKNPNIRYRPASWYVRASTAYKSKARDIAVPEYETYNQRYSEYWTFVAKEITGGLLTAPLILSPLDLGA